MKKFWLKTFSVSLAAMTLLSGCAGKEKANKDEGVMTITWLGYPGYASSESGSYSQKLIEDKFGVKIEPIFYDSDGYKQTKPLLMAGGDIPDLIYELDPANVQADAKQGFLAEIDYDLIKENAPEMVKMLNESAPGAWLYSYYDGKNYGIPNLYYSGGFPQVCQWRGDWLDAVGIKKVPETLDEMHDAFVKFVNEDPDGNGKKDTYGMSGDVTNSWFCFSEIFGAYGVTPFNWMEKDGKIVYGGVTDETKQALQLLSDWYNEGLIHPDFITDTTGDTSIGERFNNGQIGYNSVGAYLASEFDPDYTNSRASVMKQINPKAYNVPGTLPKGPDGKSGGFAWGMGGHVIAMGRHLEKEPEKMKKILEIMEYMCTDQDFSMKLLIGEEGTHYKLNTEKGGFDWIPPYDNIQNRNKELCTSNMDSSSFFNIVPAKWETRNKFRTKAQVEHFNKYIATQNYLTDYFMKADVIPESDKYLSDLKNKQLTYFAKIIRGEQPVSYYDNFISEFEQQGGDILTKNANNMSKIREEIYAKIK